MKILSECNLSEIVFEILNGKTLVFPTETSYGLGCDATNQSAVDKIFKIKGRKSDKPLLVVVPTVEMAKKFLVWNDTLDELSKKYWPGALTIVGEVLPLSNSLLCEGERDATLASAEERAGRGLARGVIANDNTVAIRVTSLPLLVSITEKIGRPLVATSANISDAGEIYDAEKIYQTFESRPDQPDFILNYGTLPVHPPTTIIRVNHDKIEVLRQGEVAVEL